MLVLSSPKGWTGPDVVDGAPVEGPGGRHGAARQARREAQAPASAGRVDEELSPAGAVCCRGASCGRAQGARAGGPTSHERQPARKRRHAAPRAAADFREYAVPVEQPGASEAEPTRVQGALMRDVMRLNAAAGNFRIVSPDELTSNRWDAVLEATSRMSSALILDTDSRVERRPSARDAERAPVRGLARGVSPHRPPRLLQLL